MHVENLISSVIYKRVSILSEIAYDCDNIIEYIKSESVNAVILVEKIVKLREIIMKKSIETIIR